MASIGYVDTLIAPLPAEMRKALTDCFTYAFATMLWGPVVNGRRAVNGQQYFISFLLPAVANQEIAVAHGLSAVPNMAVPVLDVRSANSAIVPLTITRKADDHYLYLKSSSVNVPVTLLVDGGSPS
jgi:hypothetical protein